MIIRGRSSGVERNLAKVEVVGSNPIARSIFSREIKEHWSHTLTAARQLAAEQCTNRRFNTCRIRADGSTFVPKYVAERTRLEFLQPAFHALRTAGRNGHVKIFIHKCVAPGCLDWGCFGFRVSLRNGERGQWYCAAHVGFAAVDPELLPLQAPAVPRGQLL